MKIPQPEGWTLFKYDFKRKFLGHEYVDIMSRYETDPSYNHQSYLRVRVTRDGRRWVNTHFDPEKHPEDWLRLTDDGKVIGSQLYVSWRKSL